MKKALKQYKTKYPRIGRHEVLIQYIVDNSQKFIKNFYTANLCANKLKRIKDYRTHADYYFNKKITDIEATTVLKESADIIKYVNTLYTTEDESRKSKQFFNLNYFFIFFCSLTMYFYLKAVLIPKLFSCFFNFHVFLH